MTSLVCPENEKGMISSENLKYSLMEKGYQMTLTMYYLYIETRM